MPSTSKKLPYYYQHLNSRFLNALPSGLGQVMEFGCAAGVLGMHYKKSNPQTVWHGIEINELAAEYARGNLDGIWVRDANKLVIDGLPEERYDAIVYGDVIEHLIDPVRSMPAHLELLRPGGSLLACIPNIQHWTILKELLGGQWTYRSSGLLDNTHLRFFTRQSIIDLVKKLGLEKPSLVRFSYENDARLFKRRGQERDQFLETIGQASDAMGISNNPLDFRTFQYFVSARKPD